MEDQKMIDRRLSAIWMNQFFLLCLLMALPEPTCLAAGETWQVGSSMTQERRNHSTTVLQSGKVLTCGGGRGNHSDATDTCELYDPDSGSANATAPLKTARRDHGAVELESGDVLIFGGHNETDGDLASAELYTPRSDTWRNSSPLHHARRSAPIVVLADGRVVVFGGTRAGTGHLASVEIYDPIAEVWTESTPLPRERGGHTATRLEDGRVLLVGGAANTGPDLNTAILFDPMTESFIQTASMAVGRRWHTAVRLGDGRVLVAGGRAATPVTDSVEVFDPEDEIWTSVANLTAARYGHHAVLLTDGTVLVTGGTDSLENAFTSTEIYHPLSDSWKPGPDLLTGRWFHTLSLLGNGSVMVAGGRNPAFGGPQSSREIFTADQGDWIVPAPMVTPRYGAARVLLSDGRLLVVNGRDEASELPPVAELYDPVTNSWTAAASPAVGRIGHFATLLHNGRVLVGAGAHDDLGEWSITEIYDPISDAWSTTGSLSTPRIDPTALLLEDGRVLVTAGWNNDTVGLASTEIFDPQTGTWEQAAPLHQGRRHHASIRLADGRVLVTGGAHPGGLLASTEVYDPLANTWTVDGDLNERRVYHALSLLPDGRVLVTGGDNTAQTPFQAEIFDPVLGAWSRTGNLTTGHIRHQSVALTTGKVLIVGGFGATEEDFGAELFDPTSGAFTRVGTPRIGRERFATALLASGNVLVIGGRDEDGVILPGGEVFVAALEASRRPLLTQAPDRIYYQDVPALVVDGVFDRPPAGDGTDQDTARLRPSLRLSALANGQLVYLEATGPTAGPLTIGELPDGVSPGWYRLSAHAAGIPSVARFIHLECQVSIDQHPTDVTRKVGESAVFRVEARGVRSWQWQRTVDGIFHDIPDATSPSYTTPPVAGFESGTVYRVAVSNGCSSAISLPAVLTVEDEEHPTVRVVAPNGGDFIRLSEEGVPTRSLLATWSMEDDLRICRVEVDLLFSKDQGVTWDPWTADPLPATFGTGGACAHPGVLDTSLLIPLPTEPPSGALGSQYRLRVKVVDHAGKLTEDRSDQPFFLVKPGAGTKKTLFLTHLDRMQELQNVDDEAAADLRQDLEQLAAHPEVQGLIVDLGSRPSLGPLYEAWDRGDQDPLDANRVLFDEGGIATTLQEVYSIYTGLEYLVVVGDDQVIPFARVRDTTALVTEKDYVAGPDLRPGDTTVGRALRDNFYLSDDPLAMRIQPSVAEVNEALHLPDLAVGRLVETPDQIRTAVSTFLAQDGLIELDLRANPKALITGYDFFADSAQRMSGLLRGLLGNPSVDDALIGQGWGEEDVFSHLCDASGEIPFPLMLWNGHANHYVLGHPTTSAFEVAGVGTTALLSSTACDEGGSLHFTGGIVLSPGCHVGLPVAGTHSADNPLDLPEALLSRGVLAYVANTGYGWGLRHGVGYSERLMELMVEELVVQGTVRVGKALQDAKLQYFLETPRFDPYDQKILQQWTLFGLPMLEAVLDVPVDVPIDVPVDVPIDVPDNQPSALRGPAQEQMTPGIPAPAPAHLTRMLHHIDFSGPGVYRKYDAEGEELPSEDIGCPHEDGCYYRLNGRATGRAGLPILPQAVYRSHLSGTSQHGVLWLGGNFVEERGWRSVFAELTTNVDADTSLSDAPRKLMIEPFAVHWEADQTSASCGGSDGELNSLLLTTAEVHHGAADEPPHSVLRRHLTTDLEVLYYNNQDDPSSGCDRAGPTFGPAIAAEHFHQLLGNALHFEVPVEDPAGVWRVVVVFENGLRDELGRGSWDSLELTRDDSSGTWRGTLTELELGTLSYVVQAVDLRGNVGWYDYVTATQPTDPNSGVEFDVPMVVEVEITDGVADLSVTASATPDLVGPGQPVYYEISVANAGPDSAAMVEAAFSPPSGASRVFAGGEGWSCTATEFQVDCQRGHLDSAESAPPLEIFLLAPEVVGLHWAEVSVAGRDLDPMTVNNTTSITTVVGTDGATAGIFSDGFESGGMSKWSGGVGLAPH